MFSSLSFSRCLNIFHNKKVWGKSFTFIMPLSFLCPSAHACHNRGPEGQGNTSTRRQERTFCRAHNGGLTWLCHKLWKELVQTGAQSRRSVTVPSDTIPGAPKGPWPGLSSDTKCEVMSMVSSPHGTARLRGVPIVCEACGPESMAHNHQKPLHERRNHIRLTRCGLLAPAQSLAQTGSLME